jgi:regulatory protein
MADGRVARLDGIASGGEGNASAPVARFGELLATEATPERVDGSPVPVAPADLRQLGTDDTAPPAPVADLADPVPASEPAGPVALFDSPSLGAGRDDVAVAELGPGALKRRGGGSRRAARGSGRDLERGANRRTGENPGMRGRPGRAASPEPVGDRTSDAGDPAGSDGAETSEPRRRPRGRRGREPQGLDPDADPVAVAREVCLRLLTDRARTRQELARALRRKGVPDEAAHTVLERFDEVGLIDDAAFAGQWVRSRHTHRGLARRAIAVELRRKGVSDEDAGEALAEVDAESEERRARELVERKLRSLAVGTAEQRAVAGRRLVGMLARKGYGAGIAYRVVKEALAERGAEADELGDGEVPED